LVNFVGGDNLTEDLHVLYSSGYYRHFRHSNI